MKLIVQNVKKKFNQKEVLRGASFTFEKGKIYGLLGRNGAGKTTLFNCINEDIRADEGSFFIEEVDETFGLFPPFYTDCGKNITVGKRVFINMGCKFQDQGGITIDDGALIGHNVVLATLNHDPNPAARRDMHPRPIHIGKNVWIGAGAVILPGVTVGDNAIVAAGAVVSRDVEPGTVVAGVPARKIKNIR